MKKSLIVLVPAAFFAISCASHHQHAAHQHIHGPDCGHVAILHDGHVDYLDQGHLHHLHNGHYDEDVIEVSAANPDGCTANHFADHTHNASCGHSAVPHENHVDYLVDGHLHHPDGDHCDDHGLVAVVK